MSIKTDSLNFRNSIVDQINSFDGNVNVNPTQRARYHIPTWQLVLSLIPAKNDEKGGITAREIHRQINEMGYNINLSMVRHTLNLLMNPEDAIHPSRRSIGVRAYEAIQAVGGVFNTPSETPSKGRGRRQHTYTLGITTRKLDSNKVTYHFNYDSEVVSKA